jgi:hypothetical protein
MKKITQQGSTLFISLMLLLAISIVSLAGMRTSLLELVIANNKQQFSNTFQAAEKVANDKLAALSLSINGTEVADQTIETFTEVDVFAGKDQDAAAIKIAKVNSKILYRSQTPSLGWDLNQGVAYHFQMEVEAEAPSEKSKSKHKTGFYIIAPSAK